VGALFLGRPDVDADDPELPRDPLLGRAAETVEAVDHRHVRESDLLENLR